MHIMALDPTSVQYAYKLLVILLYSFFITFWSVPGVLKNLIKYKYVVQDKYKRGKDPVATMGGISILIGVLGALALSQILFLTSSVNQQNMGALFIFYFIVIVYALYGVIDDMFSFKKRYDKIIILLVLTFPIASLITDTTLNLGFMIIDLGALYPLVIVPIYVMVVANLINLHAGYNGLTQGLSLILLITIGIQSFIEHGVENLIFLMPVLGAVIAFLPTTFVPARMLPGNIGDFLVGAAIGCLIIVNNFLWFGIFILIPHIINFLMDTWTIVIRKVPDVKFGKIRADNTLEAPASMRFKSLKFLVCHYFRLTESQAVLVMYGITIFFCVLGLIIW